MDQPASLTAGPEGPVLQVDVEQGFASGFSVCASLDVHLRPGSMLVLFGPSGAGKTTILRQIAGLERPDAGTIRFGREVWCDIAGQQWRPPQERRVGVVFQEPTLFPHLTVRDNIRYGVPIGSRPGRDPVAISSAAGRDQVASRLQPGRIVRIQSPRLTTPAGLWWGPISSCW